MPSCLVAFWNNAIGVGHNVESMLTELQRLQAKDLDNWEQRRVKRLKGEIDGILE